MRRAVILIVAACPTAHADDVSVTVTLTPQGQQLAQGLAAKSLGISRVSLWKKMRRYGIA